VQAEAQPQAEPEALTEADVARNRPPRAHASMLTVAVRGPIADKMREMAKTYGLSLAKLLMDAVLVYEARVAEGYEPSTRLGNWTPDASGEPGQRHPL
jgi:hypothetical protein